MSQPGSQQLLEVLKKSEQPLDAYQIARQTGLTPMNVGRSLMKLVKKGQVRYLDELGSANDLSARVIVVG